jgi:hypothetical protein
VKFKKLNLPVFSRQSCVRPINFSRISYLPGTKLENDRGRIEKEVTNIALFSKSQPVNLNL